jgi:plastocyanin
MTMRKSIPAIVMAAALLGAACAKSTIGAQAGSPTPSAASSSSGGGYGRYGGGSSPSPAPSVAADTLQQGVGGALAFTPTTITVAKGATLTVTDVTGSHTFTVPNTNIDVVNAAGQTQTVTINLKAGTYPFICRFHVSLGMKGTLIVTG